jgi:hypothetical protein
MGRRVPQALKKDFTRSGRRTLGGLLTDGLSSVQRLVQNNFADVYRQAPPPLSLLPFPSSPFSPPFQELSDTRFQRPYFASG